MIPFITKLRQRNLTRNRLFNNVVLTYNAILESHRSLKTEDEETRALMREFEEQTLDYFRYTSSMSRFFKYWYSKDMREDLNHLTDMVLHVSRVSISSYLYKDTAL